MVHGLKDFNYGIAILWVSPDVSINAIVTGSVIVTSVQGVVTVQQAPNTVFNVTGNVTVSGSVTVTSGSIIVTQVQGDVTVVQKSETVFNISGNVTIQNPVININVTNPALNVGNVKPALAFGGDDYVNIANLNNYPTGTQAFTVLVLCLATGAGSGSWRVTFSWGAYAVNDGQAIGLSNTNKFYCGIHGTVIVDPDAPTYNQPVWLGYRYAGGASGLAELIVNGVVKASANITPATTKTRSYIGAYIQSPPALYWYGNVYIILFYNRALSNDEISNIINNPYAPPTNGLIGAWYCDEGSGTTVYDKSGNNNNGTIYGATWVSSQGSVSSLVNVNLTAQSLSEVKINIAAQTIENLRININAQSIGIYAITDWSAKNATDIDFYGYNATAANNSWYALISYTVPAGKTLLIYDYCATVYGVAGPVYGRLYNATDAKEIHWAQGAYGVNVQFTKPKRITEGKEVRLYVLQNSGATQWINGMLGGILV
jgi:hypothetical protein